MKFDLVFEGGGAKGTVFVGAIEMFEKEGCQVGRLLGTSAGAITATLLAAGYNSQEMLEALGETVDGKPVFTQFLGMPAPFTEEDIRKSTLRAFLESVDLALVPDFIEKKLDEKIVHSLATKPRFRHLFSFIERGGWYAADAYLAWMRKKLDYIYEKQVQEGVIEAQPRSFSEMSMEEFHLATGRELALVASDTTAEQMLVLNHRTAPGCPVVWAARMSMSVPLLWQEVRWQHDWGTYQNQNMDGHAIVDGGLLSNFPIELFVSDDKQVVEVMGPKQSNNVLGFLIDESLPVTGAPEKAVRAQGLDLSKLQTVQRIRQLVDTTTSAHDRAVIEAFEEMVVRLPAKGYGTTEFDMSVAKREALIEAGRETTRRYFEKHPPVARPDGDVSFGIPSTGAATGIANRRALKILEW